MRRAFSHFAVMVWAVSAVAVFGARAAKSGHSGLARGILSGRSRRLSSLCAALKESTKLTDMAGLDFVHLHVHSSYSLLEGALTIARLAELAKADRQPALALTDTDNMFGALEFSEKMAGSGIQPIIGCALAVDFGDTDHGPRNRQRASPSARASCCWPRGEDGYRSLMRLNSRAFLETPANEPPHLKLAWLDGRDRRHHRAHRRARRAARCRDRRRTKPSGGRALDAAARAVRRPALCRAAAPRHAGRAREPSRR